LPVQVAILRKSTIAEIGPETVESPSPGREQLSLIFEASIGIPVLRREEEAAERLSATRIDRTNEDVRDLKSSISYLGTNEGVAWAEQERTCGSRAGG
jgi:hypothetical protein